MNVTNEWGANYYVLVGTKQLNSINAFTTAPYSNGGNVVFWIALNSQKQWGAGTANNKAITLPIAYSSANYIVVALPNTGITQTSTNNLRVITKSNSNIVLFGADSFPVLYISLGK